MNKIAVHPHSSYRDTSPSKIPRFQPADMSRNKGLQKQPSRLEMLQADYQEKLLREKEEKMIRMYEDQQKKALDRVSRTSSGNSSISSKSGPSAREFFDQRRKMEQMGYSSPPIDEHYRQMRRGNSSGGYSSASSQQSYGQNSAGKSNRLQPLDSKMPQTKPRLARQRPSYANGGSYANKTSSAPYYGNQNRWYGAHQDNSRTSANDGSPPPNLQTLRNFQKNRQGHLAARRNDGDGSKKLTDFQRWQLEQNQAKEQHLEHHRQNVTSQNRASSQWGEEDSSDGDKENQDIQAELEQRQQEIVDEIAKHKADLDRMKLQKQKEEEEERRQAEIERRKEAEREKRRKKQMEEERRRQMEEDRQRQIQEEKERQEEERIRRKNEENQRRKQQAQRRAPPPKQRTPSPIEDDYQVSDGNIDFYEQAALAGDAHGGGSVHLVPCKMCGRKFAADRLGKHQAACKNANKKRKVFDPAKMRTEGTEMAKYVGQAQEPKKKPKTKDWRAQHESFIETIRYAKKVSEMEASGARPQDLPPPPKTHNPDYVQCPTCNRNFNPSTAEKHIPNCRARPRRR